MKDKKKIQIIIILLVTVFCCAVLAWVLIGMNTHEKIVQDGQIDISQWNGEDVLLLSGEWDFYWNEFLDKDALSQNPTPDLKAEVPSVWNNYIIDGEQLNGMGYATYRLHVIGAEVGAPFAMRIIPFSTAYNIYIDDELVASSGTVSTSKDGFDPQYQIETVTFTPEQSEFDIILHISNFVYARGGAWYTIYFGNPEEVVHVSQMIFARDFFAISCLLLVSVYGLFLFLMGHDKGYLMFISLSIVFILRTSIDGSYIINSVLPSISFRAIICIDYITLYWLPGLCVWLYRYIYPKNMSYKFLKFLLIYASVMTVITLVLPIYIFTNFIYISELVAVVTSIYGISEMLLLALNKKWEVFFMFAGGSVLTTCVFHDLLCENNLLKTGYVEWSSMGFLVHVILLQCMFWIRYYASNKENERMLIELNKANERERKLELQFLKSQIRPHFINNALNAIISVSRTNGEKSRKLLIEFSKYLQNCYNLGHLDDKIPIENELSFVRAYVALEQARFPDSLYIEYDIDNIFLMLPPLTLQPLVENAIIHGIKGKLGDGHVLIYVKDCGEFIKVGVTDDGIGISNELIEKLLSNERKSTGVGIYNINRRMKQMYNTELYLKNCADGGIDAYIIIPKEETT